MITYNHIIKFILISLLIGLLFWSNIIFWTYSKDDLDSLSTWYRALYIFGFISDVFTGIIITIIIGATIGSWADGNFDDVLNKPVVTFSRNKTLTQTLKEHFEEARRINDGEEITRLTNSLEIIEKYGK